jgi:hypothetical protein
LAQSELDEFGARVLMLRARLEEAFQRDTAAPGFYGATPSTGHCAAVAVILNRELGGEFVSVMVNGMSHWFNRLQVSGGEVDVDITGDQFGYPPVRIAAKNELHPGGRVRTSEEVTKETVSRARRLAERAGLTHVADALAGTQALTESSERTRVDGKSKSR